ncbi:MAG: PAS domain-containing protein [Chloroflexi bacterium]|nr:PAS domain-containing protein [Chloroflexota bacterium]
MTPPGPPSPEDAESPPPAPTSSGTQQTDASPHDAHASDTLSPGERAFEAPPGSSLPAAAPSGAQASDPALADPSGWAFVRDADHPACLLDRDLRYRECNAAWGRLQHRGIEASGATVPPGQRRRFLDDVPDERRVRWQAALGRILAGRLAHFVDEADEPASGGRRHVVTTATPVPGHDGRPCGVLCARYDVTDGRQSAANEAHLMAVLVAARNLQHHLGNQLALTMGYVELMSVDSRLPEVLQERMDEALRGVIEATETLTRLRGVTRLEIPPGDPSLDMQ